MRVQPLPVAHCIRWWRHLRCVAEIVHRSARDPHVRLPPRRLHLSRTLVLTMCVLLGACQEAPTGVSRSLNETVAREPPLRTGSTSSTRPPPPGTCTWTSPSPTRANQQFGPVSTGCRTGANAFVTISVSGMMTASPNPEYTCCIGIVTSTYTFGPSGISGGPQSGQGRVMLATPGGWTSSDTGSSVVFARTSFTSDAPIQFSRSAVQGGGSCSGGTTANPGCVSPSGPTTYYAADMYLLRGTQTVVVMPSARTLRVTATPQAVAEGDSTTFVVSASSSPITVTAWLWQPDSAGPPQSLGCPTGENMTRCRARITGSGVLYARASVGPAWQKPPVEQAGAPVDVTPVGVALSVSVSATLPIVTARSGSAAIGTLPSTTAATPSNKPPIPSIRRDASVDADAATSVTAPVNAVVTATATPVGGPSSFAIETWTFVTDDGGTQVLTDCVAGAATCRFAARTDGLLTVSASVNGLMRSASRRIVLAERAMTVGGTDVDVAYGADSTSSGDDGPTFLPNCQQPKGTAQRLWCEGWSPKARSIEELRVYRALNDMNARGGVCATLAQEGFRTLNLGSLRFNDLTALNAGGAAPPNGAAAGQHWFLIDEYWVLKHYDAAHAARDTDHPEWGARTLQHLLAHELDHLVYGLPHLVDAEGRVDLSRTEHTRMCADAPSAQ